jgi:hypothetical protein
MLSVRRENPIWRKPAGPASEAHKRKAILTMAFLLLRR